MGKIVIIFAILLAVTLAKADTGLGGVWTGWGIWTYGDSGINCNMQIQFDESEKQIDRVGGKFDCNVLALYSDPLKWDKQDGQLLLDGVANGQYRDGFVQMSEPVNDNTLSTTTVQINGDKATYSEVWSQGEKVIYKIEGNLKRKQ